MAEQNDNTEAQAPEEEPTSDAPNASAPETAPDSESHSPAAEAPLAPKERRQRARAARAASAPSRPPRSPEERQAERREQRRRKAEVRRSTRQRARAKSRRDGEPKEPTAPRESQPPVQKTRQGVVVSDRPDKTITVRIDLARRHRRYKKIVRTSSTLHVHDERNDANLGDTVVVRECRPISRTKHWRLVEVVERAK